MLVEHEAREAGVDLGPPPIAQETQVALPTPGTRPAQETPQEDPDHGPGLVYPAFLEEQEGWVPFEQRQEINGVVPMSDFEIYAIWETELQIREQEIAPAIEEYDRLIAERVAREAKGIVDPPYCGTLVTFGDRRVAIKIDVYNQFLKKMIKLAKKHKCQIDDVIACAVHDYLRKFEKP